MYLYSKKKFSPIPSIKLLPSFSFLLCGKFNQKRTNQFYRLDFWDGFKMQFSTKALGTYINKLFLPSIVNTLSLMLLFIQSMEQGYRFKYISSVFLFTLVQLIVLVLLNNFQSFLLIHVWLVSIISLFSPDTLYKVSLFKLVRISAVKKNIL